MLFIPTTMLVLIQSVALHDILDPAVRSEPLGPRRAILDWRSGRWGERSVDVKIEAWSVFLSPRKH